MTTYHQTIIKLQAASFESGPDTQKNITPDLDTLEPSEENYDGEKLYKKIFFTEKNKRMFAVGVIGTLTTLGLLGIGFSNAAKANPNIPTIAGDSADPGNNEKASTDISEEAQQFINEHSNEYGNATLSVYNSDKSLINAGGKSAILTKEFIDTNSKLPESFNFRTNELEFTTSELPFDTKMDQKASMDLFNKFIPNLEHYMDLIAKNIPFKGAFGVIDYQFLAQCAQIAPLKHDVAPPSGEKYDEAIKLLDMLKKIATTYGGSASTFRIGRASSDTNDIDATLFNENTPTHVGHDPKNPNIATAWTDSGVTLCVEITTYNESAASTKYIRIGNCQIDAVRDFNPFPDSKSSTVTYGLSNEGVWYPDN